MSYIDIFRHEYCGRLAGIPLYHLLEDSPLPENGGEFYGATTGHLLLGGGSGELPAAIFNPLHAVTQLVGNLLDWFDPESKDYAEWDLQFWAEIGFTEEVLEDLWQSLMDARGSINDFYLGNYSDWSSNMWFMTKKAAQSKANWNPYKKKVHLSLESWLSNSIGEYILVSMPELLDQHGDFSKHKVALDKVKELLAHGPHYGNVQQFPTGYQVGGHGEAGLGSPNMRF